MSAKQLLLAILMATLLTSCKPQTRSSVLNYSMPEEAVRCVAGDYIIRNMATNSWKVFRIEKAVLISPLRPIAADYSIFREEMQLNPGNNVPEGWQEIHFIATAFQKDYPTEE
ncbi:MAG: hypothetical protein JWR19_1318 [Pedosphaera sp.]|nr:hypothetical protein [Pedosphaera sp.]